MPHTADYLLDVLERSDAEFELLVIGGGPSGFPPRAAFREAGGRGGGDSHRRKPHALSAAAADQGADPWGDR